MKIKIKKLNPQAIIPAYAHSGDAGLDVHSLEDYELKPGARKAFGVGFALEVEPSYVVLVKDRGSLPQKAGIHTLAGVGDSGYRGEYQIVLINLGQKAYTIKKGDKIAQLLIMPVEQVEVEEVKELSATSRGQGCFGSTGR